jgi:CIC family chloride channel protein
MFRHDEYDRTRVKKLMTIPRITATLHDDVNTLMTWFDEYNVWNIPVVDQEGKYLGFISKTGVLNQYRSKLISQETL